MLLLVLVLDAKIKISVPLLLCWYESIIIRPGVKCQMFSELQLVPFDE